jgi:hypothetical protein
VNEPQWSTGSDAQAMLRWLCDRHHCHRRKAGRRKLRLFGCACCRLRWEEMVEPGSRAAVEFVERWADDEALAAGLEQAQQEAAKADAAVFHHWVVCGNWGKGPEALAQSKEQEEASAAARVLVHKSAATSAYADGVLRSWVGEGTPGSDQEKRHRAWSGRLGRMAHLLRDIFGNPYRPVKFKPAWRTAAVVGLAQALYESRDFAAMPVLADALEDAGCDDAAVLAHCRGPRAFHVRGCWVVDLILGR